MTAHTALPWTSQGWAVIGGDGYAVGTLDQAFCPAADYETTVKDIERSEDEVDANARLIVRAVNAHAGLVEALEALTEAADNGEWHNSEDCRIEKRADCGLCQALALALAALATARGE